MTVKALSFGFAGPVFGLPADPLGFGFADPVFVVVAGPVDAEDELSSDDVSASATGTGLLANATPSPSATVAAAARVVSMTGFIESSDRSGGRAGRLRGGTRIFISSANLLPVSNCLFSSSWQVVRLTDAR
ncbi:hypothetical protein ORI20_20220 [Mycobacterium sp. CVI_P3]|uniref:Secreted protein n=1 Tax=Mycobacterium pinniadriaticum TaxID=2994102 RepID=A0ABT3SII8_9MYCO|nr:hypothetical protein [Mycobacterium pinniadriaticum]MCX2932603.1 hypothetical protein [Mycobacterium pinniadriaticum]MCX2938953.1 hypothetical protein [Mycobacterium pinniadriaticum]